MTEEVTQENATQLPEPTGYRILCAVPDLGDTLDEEGLIIKADKTKEL